MEPKLDHLDVERANFDFFLEIPEIDRKQVKFEMVKGSQLLQPLFEYSGACPGCGETPYLKLMSQLFGDRAMIGNATGCSSIYGGNLPTTPYRPEQPGTGPDVGNSLFEDNAEFGLGLRLAVDSKSVLPRELLRRAVAGDGRRPGLRACSIAHRYARGRDRGPAGPRRRAAARSSPRWTRPRPELLLRRWPTP